MDFSKRLTDNARDVLAHSEVIARSSGSAYIGTEHLLLGILSQEQSTAAELLRTAGITFDQVRQALQLVPPAGVDSLLLSPTRGFSETAKLTMRMSVELASEFHQDYCGTEHILFSLLSQKNARAATVLADQPPVTDPPGSGRESGLRAQNQEGKTHEQRKPCG
jgi:ATP-dependent Clp protease ATP-binding subunit ClpC